MTVLANLTRRAYALEEPPEYVVYQGPMYGEGRQYWATVHIYGRGLSPEHTYRSLEGQLPLSHKPSNWQPEKL